MQVNDWPLFPRPHYMRQLRDAKDSPFIKIITGLRRSGKSTVMRMFRDELISSGVPEGDTFYLDTEDNDPMDYDDLKDIVESHIVPGRGKYLFFDEIQNVECWETAIRMFYNKGADIYITGSNSKMLSSELSTKLSGRSLEIKMAPLVFSEYREFRKDSGKTDDELFSDFIRYGGLPAVALSMDRQPKRMISEIIAGTYSTVYVKDIIERHEIRNPAGLSNLIRFLMRNVGDRTSSRKAANYMTSNGVKISHNAIEEYLDYVVEAFLALRSKRMDHKTQEYLVTQDKFYAQDLGIKNHLNAMREDDIDGVLENVVYNELVYRYGDVSVCSVGRYEVDFVADPMGKPSYFQVCTSINDEPTRNREMRPLKMIQDNYPKTIITYERFILDDIDGVKVVALMDWLKEGIE